LRIDAFPYLVDHHCALVFTLFEIDLIIESALFLFEQIMELDEDQKDDIINNLCNDNKEEDENIIKIFYLDQENDYHLNKFICNIHKTIKIIMMTKGRIPNKNIINVN